MFIITKRYTYRNNSNANNYNDSGDSVSTAEKLFDVHVDTNVCDGGLDGWHTSDVDTDIGDDDDDDMSDGKDVAEYVLPSDSANVKHASDGKCRKDLR